MSRIFSFLLTMLTATTLSADEAGALSAVEAWQEDRTQMFDATEVDLEEFIWLARPVVVFADSPNDPRFRQQIELLMDRPEVLADRDVVVLIDTDPSARSAARERLRPRGFALVLIAKNGEVAQRKPAPWDVRELTRAIDKMPLRIQEINDALHRPN